MNSQLGNHNYNREHKEYLTKAIALASPELREKANEYDWSMETLASEALKEVVE